MTPNQVERLCQWYERTHRKLPWRETSDPYRIWISEVMLQQTQVITAIPFYLNFLSHLPNLTSLADVPETKLLTLWSGLGYYSRARNLKKGANYIIQNFGGNFPSSPEALTEIPGIGPYTAGAISSIAFNKKAPLVDGNVQRVFARFYLIDQAIELPAVKQKMWELAREAVSLSPSARVFNQALMELGALICTKSSPHCEHCPLQSGCRARREQRQNELPTRRPRRPQLHLYWAPLVVQRGNKIVVQQNPEGKWWAKLWDFPRIEASSEAQLKRKLTSWAKARGLTSPPDVLGRTSHTVTHHKIGAVAIRARVAKTDRTTVPLGRWVTRKEFSQLPLSSFAKKVWALAEEQAVLK